MISLNNYCLYRNKDLIENASLEFDDSKIHVLFGESGIGKTSLLLSILGYLQPLSGEVLVDSRNLYSMAYKEKNCFINMNIGFLSQDGSLIDSISVLDNITLPIMNDNDFISGKQRAIELMEELGILELQNFTASRLSGGEKKRVEIARMLINNPHYLIMDEPSANLDGENVDRLSDLIIKYKEIGKTIIISSHDERMRKISDHTTVYNIKDRQIVRVDENKKE